MLLAMLLPMLLAVLLAMLFLGLINECSPMSVFILAFGVGHFGIKLLKLSVNTFCLKMSVLYKCQGTGFKHNFVL